MNLIWKSRPSSFNQYSNWLLLFNALRDQKTNKIISRDVSPKKITFSINAKWNELLSGCTFVNALHGEEKIVYTLSACLTARKIWISIDDSWPNFFFRYFTLFSKAFSQCIYIFLIRNICINELANVSQLSFTATQYSSDCARSLAHSLNAIQLVWWMQFRCIDCCCCGWLLYRFQIDTVRL